MYHHHCKPNVTQPIVHPTNHCCTHTEATTIVPHIHPQHLTNVHHQNFQHVHYFPQTFSQVNAATHQHFACGGPGCNM